MDIYEFPGFVPQKPRKYNYLNYSLTPGFIFAFEVDLIFIGHAKLYVCAITRREAIWGQ